MKKVTPLVAGKITRVFELIQSGVNSRQAIADKLSISYSSAENYTLYLLTMKAIENIGGGRGNAPATYRPVKGFDFDGALKKITFSDTEKSPFITESTLVINGVRVNVRTVEPRHTTRREGRCLSQPRISLQNYQG